MTANTLLNSQEVRKPPAGALFKAIFVISYISQKSDKNGKPYYDVTATDGLGTVEAKVWSDAQWLDKSEAAPQSDDVTKFILSSGFEPLGVAAAAALLFAVCALLMVYKRIVKNWWDAVRSDN